VSAAATAAAAGASPSRIDRQEAVALRALSPWTVSAARQWQVSSREGKSIVLGGEPLADQLDAANRCAGRSVLLPVYRIAPAAAGDPQPALAGVPRGSLRGTLSCIRGPSIGGAKRPLQELQPNAPVNPVKLYKAHFLEAFATDVPD
jgi:hypothetical protein